jgi:hypothetical protein
MLEIQLPKHYFCSCPIMHNVSVHPDDVYALTYGMAHTPAEFYPH